MARSRRASAVNPTTRTTPVTTCKWLSVLPPVKTQTAGGPGWTSAVLRRPEEVFAPAELRDKSLQLGSGWREKQPLGPDRKQLLALVSSP